MTPSKDKRRTLIVKCILCGGEALGNYKSRPGYGKCMECFKVFRYSAGRTNGKSRLSYG